MQGFGQDVKAVTFDLVRRFARTQARVVDRREMKSAERYGREPSSPQEEPGNSMPSAMTNLEEA